MEKETAKGTSGWTVETAIVYFKDLFGAAEAKNQQQFKDAEKAVGAALAAAEKAVAKAEYNAEKWRDSANEWRQAMDDREIKFMPRQEYSSAHQALIDRIGMLENRVNRNEGTGLGLKQGWGYLVAAVIVIATIIGLYLKNAH